MKVIYVAGPFRSRHAYGVHCNIAHAEALALKVWALNVPARQLARLDRSGEADVTKRVAVICPHANTAHFDGTLPDAVWLEGDLELLRRSDAVIVTENWRESTGAVAEVRAANALGIPVFDAVGELERWLALLEQTVPHPWGMHDLRTVVADPVSPVPAACAACGKA